jgi:prophage DNA circulation protein
VSFLDRLRECRYVSPSGAEFTPLFDDLERSGGKKLAVHELPFRDIADVQEFGEQAETFSMDLYFTGADYDLTADAFYAALREKGRGTLKHPRWGDRTVLPSKRGHVEKFVDEVWIAHIHVDFIEAPDPASLTITSTTAAAISSAADVAQETIAASAPVSLGAIEAAATAVKASWLVTTAMAALKFIASIGDGISAAMTSAERAFERDVNTMIGTDLPALFDTICTIYRYPAQVETDIKTKVQAYSDLLQQSIDAFGGLVIEVCALLGITTAAAESTSTGGITSRADAMEAYNLLTDMAERAFETVDGYVDPSTLAAVRQIVSDARARLLVESYSLPTERTMVLTETLTPVQLAAQFYSDPEQYPRVIAENALADDLIFAVPAGFEVRWYE